MLLDFHPRKFRKIEFKIKRGGEAKEIESRCTSMNPGRCMIAAGVLVGPRVVKASGPIDAVVWDSRTPRAE